jgi:hypothetical protein
MRQPAWRKQAASTHVNFALPGGSTQADVVRKVAEELHWRISSLPIVLREKRYIRGRTVFHTARAVLDAITEEHELGWTVEEGVLRLGVDLRVAHRLGGRPRKDDERQRVLALRKENKTWRQIANILNVKLKQSKSPDAYRKLANP